MMCLESIKTAFRFHIEYLDNDGRVISDDTLTLADFAHAVRSARFDAYRRGAVAHYDPAADEEAVINPLFQDDSPSPQIRGFEVLVDCGNGAMHPCEFATRYFSPFANRLRAERIRNEVMTAEQELYYRVNAFLDDDSASDDAQRPPIESNAAAKFTINLESTNSIVVASPKPRSSYGPTQAWDEPLVDDLPILIEQHVLEESVEEARADPDREVAGFLLGSLHRDPETQQVFVAVTGLVSASGTTEASSTSVTYTPASFAKLKEVIKLRGSDEMICGWFHSHPFKLCSECPLPTPPECIAKVLFYSTDDFDLMQTTFEQPFMVGLLAAVEPRIEEAIGHLPVKVYGWRSGEIQSRGFEVMNTE